MISFPNAKINIGLRITAKRPDGYHDLETVFYPVGIRDVLEIVPSKQFVFSVTGRDVPGDPAANSCVKAYQVLAERYPLPPVHIHLHKVIPAGAGLGGGSSDAAFTLNQLNRQFDLRIPDADLETLAATLGADCPFFIRNRQAYATGRGDVFEPADVRLSGYFLALVLPGIHVSTAEAFAAIQPAAPEASLREQIALPVERWKDRIENQFEPAIFARYPELGVIKRELLAAGALYASMSGTGSALYGIFPKAIKLPIFEKKYCVNYATCS